MSEVSRRVTLAWFAAASTTALALEGCAAPEPPPTPAPVPATPVSLWQDLTPAPVTAPTAATPIHQSVPSSVSRGWLSSSATRTTSHTTVPSVTGRIASASDRASASWAMVRPRYRAGDAFYGRRPPDRRATLECSHRGRDLPGRSPARPRVGGRLLWGHGSSDPAHSHARGPHLRHGRGPGRRRAAVGG